MKKQYLAFLVVSLLTILELSSCSVQKDGCKMSKTFVGYK